MNIVKSAKCQIREDSKWLSASAMCMGLSAFVRMVYYFGLINLRDLDGFALIVNVVLPLMVAAAYLVLAKGFRMKSPVFFGGLLGVYTLNYLMMMRVVNSGVIAGVLLVVYAAAFVVTGLGYIPNRIPVACTALILILFRLFVVDFFGYILPLEELRLFDYLPEASNLFGFLSFGLVAPAMCLTSLENDEKKDSAQPAVAE